MCNFAQKEAHYESHFRTRSFIPTVEKVHPTGFRQQKDSRLSQKGYGKGGQPMKITEDKGPNFKESLHDAMKKLGQAKQEKDEKKGSAKSG